ncbi:MAG: glycine cleavage system aminomethyltransferase GcvT [Myxococcales bacterium]|nr:MAG: glycine cleavage system aminomethyltransferase GcvT [Myxococcales bacterium]
MGSSAVETGLRKTPLFEEHKRLGARIVPFSGWQMPVQYEGIVKEHLAVRQHAGLFDVSHMGELVITGPDAERMLDSLVTGNIAKLASGRALYCLCCNENGGVHDDLIVYRKSSSEFLVVCNASNRGKISTIFKTHADAFDCEYSDRSDDLALLALQGPEAISIMAKLGAQDSILDLPRFAYSEDKLDGIACKLARTGYTGEDGFEIFCTNADAPALWRSILVHGAKPIGLGARDTLRLEARLSLYGNEITEETNPFEAGLGWAVKLDSADFRGKAALMELKKRALSRKLVGMQMLGRGIGRHGYPVLDAQGQVIGQITSGSPSPSLDKAIALAYVKSEFASLGSQVHVQIRDKAIEAEVVPTPFYKR